MKVGFVILLCEREHKNPCLHKMIEGYYSYGFVDQPVGIY